MQWLKDALLPALRSAIKTGSTAPLESVAQAIEKHDADEAKKNTIHHFSSNTGEVMHNGVALGRASEFRTWRLISDNDFTMRLFEFAEAKTYAGWWSPHRVKEIEAAEKAFLERFAPVSADPAPVRIAV